MLSVYILALMSKKCLKLLLMPLLGAAINERSLCVEVARLKTWWHLIVALGDSRNDLFHQVRGADTRGCGQRMGGACLRGVAPQWV